MPYFIYESSAHLNSPVQNCLQRIQELLVAMQYQTTFRSCENCPVSLHESRSNKPPKNSDLEAFSTTPLASAPLAIWAFSIALCKLHTGWSTKKNVCAYLICFHGEKNPGFSFHTWSVTKKIRGYFKTPSGSEPILYILYNYLKFSAVLGTISANSSIFTLPTSWNNKKCIMMIVVCKVIRLTYF